MSDPEDAYYSIREKVTVQTKVKGSRFIGYATPVSDDNSAQNYLQSITKKHYDASHNCYAFRIGFGDKTVTRYSDAGEPSGTAGRPILNVIEGHGLSDIICVVTRYFGGTKLGTGGLARAYAECADETLKTAKKVNKIITQSFSVQFDYDLTGQVMHVFSGMGIPVENPVYDTKTKLHTRVRLSKIAAFKDELIQATAGKIEIKHV